MADFFSDLKRYKKLVDEYILSRLPRSHPIPEIGSLFEMMIDYPSRPGKGLRPSILLIFCQAFNGDINKALNTAAALELFQNWIVIHDDIEDDSMLRRGLPALHVKYGIPLALNAGDALAGRMWEFLNNNRQIIGPETTLDVIEQFLNMYNETTAGQHIELSWVRNKRWDLNREDYINMCRRKTAWYTCVTPAWTGALIAGADERFKDIIFDFGLDLGVAFQIQDDTLNIVGDEKVYGKEIGGDLWEGKRTLITIELVEKASPENKRYLKGILDLPRQKKRAEDINKVMSLISEYECVKSAIKVSVELATKARMNFSKLDGSIDETQRQIVLEMIDFMINRKF
jgi:geranylgeranyl diphosphate synthase type II